MNASLYPYMAPEGSYLLAKGGLFQLNQRDLEEGKSGLNPYFLEEHPY